MLASVNVSVIHIFYTEMNHYIRKKQFYTFVCKSSGDLYTSKLFATHCKSLISL